MARHTRQVPISSKNDRNARIAHARATREFRKYDTSAIMPKRSKAPMIIALIAILAIIVAVIGLLVFGCTYEEETLDPSEQAVIVVEEGESAADVASNLFEEHLIGNERKFMDLVNSEDAGASILPGTYLFTGGMTMDEILAALMEGPASTAEKLTVIEGETRDSIADSIAEVTGGRITAEQFLDASDDASAYVDDYEFLRSAGDNSLEGFLFPKTYPITIADEAEDVVRMMLSQFEEEISGIDMSYAEEKGYDLYEIVTLASIVQKEGVPDNFATVASVFYNRLDSSSPYLQSDATTAYEVGHDPTPEEIHSYSEYSTYTHTGLPPTPICNPSIEAIMAVCDPEDTDYMYFYSYDDGSYAFSETYEQHQSAIP